MYVCVNLNRYDSINVCDYDCTYAVKVLANGGVIALKSMCVFEMVVVNCVSPRMTPILLFQLWQFHLSLCKFWVGNNRLGIALEAICLQCGLIGAAVWPLSAGWRGGGERLLLRLKLVRGCIWGLWFGVKPD